MKTRLETWICSGVVTWGGKGYDEWRGGFVAESEIPKGEYGRAARNVTIESDRNAVCRYQSLNSFFFASVTWDQKAEALWLKRA